MSAIDCVCLDADDTLWHNEVYFRHAEREAARLLDDWADPALVTDTLLAVERANIPRYGFGAKAFVLSLVETALQLSDETLPASTVAALIDLGKSILDQPVEFLDDVVEAIDELSTRWPLILITKGDIVHQEAKVMASGLIGHFRSVEIVAHKHASTYRRILDRNGIDPRRAVMVGNSARSDILPMLEIGGFAVHVPHEHGWALEHHDLDDHPRLWRVERFGDVAVTIDTIDRVAQ